MAPIGTAQFWDGGLDAAYWLHPSLASLPGEHTYKPACPHSPPVPTHPPPRIALGLIILLASAYSH